MQFMKPLFVFNLIKKENETFATPAYVRLIRVQCIGIMKHNK